MLMPRPSVSINVTASSGRRRPMWLPLWKDGDASRLVESAAKREDAERAGAVCRNLFHCVAKPVGYEDVAGTIDRNTGWSAERTDERADTSARDATGRNLLHHAVVIVGYENVAG